MTIKKELAENIDELDCSPDAKPSSDPESTSLIVQEVAAELAKSSRALPILQEPDAVSVAIQVIDTQRVPKDVSPATRLEMEMGPVAHYLAIGPADALESALARVIVGVTNSAMDCLGRAARNDAWLKAREAELGLGIKASLAVAGLVEAFDKHRGRDRATVAVGQVNVGAGGQAIVGNVESQDRARREGGAAPTNLTPRKPHERED